MKTAKKLLLLALVVLMCLSTLVACGGGDETTTTTTTAAPAGPGNDPAQINWTQYSGKECVFFIRNTQKNGPNYLYIEEENVGTSAADIATLARLDYFKELTGITIRAVEGANVFRGTDDYNTLRSLIDANDPENLPDVLVVHGATASSLTYNGDLVCLSDPSTPNIDLSKDCWHQNINQNMAIHFAGESYTYMASGYYSTTNFENSACMYFDRDALETINPASIDLQTYPELAGYTGADSLYDWARNGEWTWDKAIALAKLFAGTNGSLNGSGVPTKSGIGWWCTDGANLMASVALNPFSENNQGIYTLDLGQEQQEKLDYLHQNLMYENGARYANFIGYTHGSSDPNWPNLFGTNHTALFNIRFVYNMKPYTEYTTETTTFRFGILPMPKYNEQQDRYYSYIGSWYSSMACIPNAVEDVGFSTFVLQHFTEFGKEKFHSNIKTIYEAVLEDGLGNRYAGATDEGAADIEMLGIVMDSVDAWLWEHSDSAGLGGLQGVGVLTVEISTKSQPNWQSFNDTNSPLVVNAMQTILVKMGLAEAA